MTQDIFSAATTIRQARVVAVAKISSAICNLAAQIYVARFLAIADYAIFTLFVAASSLLVLLSMYGIDRVAYRVIPPLRLHGRWREISTFIAASLLWRLAFIGLGVIVIGVYLVRLLPNALVLQLSMVALPLWLYVLAMSMTDSLSVYCNSVGRQGAQGKALLLIGFSRSVTIIGALLLGVSAPLQYVVWAFVLAEAAFMLILIGVLTGDLYSQRNLNAPGAFTMGFRLKDALVEGGTTQLSYLLRIPFGGPFLRLLVGSFAPPLVTAAYGFYQTLADRLYQFLPPILFKGVMEPALSADFSVHQSVSRVAMVVSVLLKLSLALIAALLAFALGIGQPMVDLVTNGKYGSQILIACLVCIQLASQVVGEVLWIALNPVGRVVVLNRVWYGATLLAGMGLATAYTLHSTWFILVTAPLPYFAVALWLRFVQKEPLLVHGVGTSAALRLLVPICTGAVMGKSCLYVLGTTSLGLCVAGVLMGLAFALTLIMIRIFSADEVRLTAHFSTTLSKLVKPFAARS